MSDGIHSGVNRERERRVRGGDFLSTQVTAFAKLITEHLLFTVSALVLAFGRKDKLVETRYGHNRLRHPDHGSDAPDSFLLGEVLVQWPAVIGDPHPIGDVESDGWVDQSLDDHFWGEHDDDADLLQLDLLERSGEVRQHVEILGVRQADLCVLDPLDEEVPPVDAKVIIAVEERGPAPVEVLQNANNYVDDFFVGMHRSQEGGKILVTWKDGTRSPIADLPMKQQGKCVSSLTTETQWDIFEQETARSP